ncbi:MAG: cytochrome P450 [Sphingomonas sp.]|nr:cytochrome P450 [Sphingomonas sp.]
MSSYAARIDAASGPDKWPLARRFMLEESQPFFDEMRSQRPILELPNLTMAFRYADCALILRRHDDFGVDLYRPKQGDSGMAQDDTADHWRDKSIMKSILDFEQLSEIRDFVAKTTAKILADAKGKIDLPAALTRAVPIAVVQRFFGMEDGDPQKLTEWSYWNQQDAFHNQPFDAVAVPDPAHIVAMREKSNIRLALFVGRLVAKRSLAVKLGLGGHDPISRLLRLCFSDGVKFPLKKVLFNSGGLLIGAVETTSHAVNNVIAELLSRPSDLDRAKAVAAGGKPEDMDGFALEALRFRPAFPYFFRTCHRPTELAGGTSFARAVKDGTTVLAVTHSAMFDEASFAAPKQFDPTRSQGDNFTFGYGIHECLGRAIAKPMVSEIVRQIVRLPDLAATGPVVFRGGVPESYPVKWRA